MLNLNKFCSLFIGLILSVVCALPLSARDINVRGTVTNIEGEPLFRVSIYNAGTNKLIGSESYCLHRWDMKNVKLPSVGN